MKKLMIAIGAAATALGLQATTYTNGFDNITSFEIETPWSAGTGITSPLPVETSDYTYGSGDLGRRIEGENAKCLKLSTSTNELTLATTTYDNTYVDQLVKFTAFEEAPTISDGTKIAIWLKEELDANAEPTATNLYVTAAYVSSGGNVTTTNLLINGSDWKADQWYRLTVRNIGNIKNEGSLLDRAGFVIYIDGQLIASDNAKSIYPSAAITTTAGAYMADGQLFPSIATTETTIQAVAYAGEGYIDDIIVDSEGPVYAQGAKTVNVTLTEIENTTVVVSNAAGTVEYPLTDNVFTVPVGTTVKIYYAPAAGYFLSGKTVYEATINAAGSLDYSPETSSLILVAVVTDEDTEATTNCESLAVALDVVNGCTSDKTYIVDIYRNAQYPDPSSDYLYAFPAGAKITVNGSEWSVHADGVVTNTFGANEGKQITVCEKTDGKGVKLVLAGQIKNGATITAESTATVEIASGKTLSLTGSGKLVTATTGLESAITSEDESKEVVYKDGAYQIATKQYTITWLNSDTTKIEDTTVEHGVVPTHEAPEAAEGYSFAGWNPTPVAATAAATYTATFTGNVYTVTFAKAGEEEGAGIAAQQYTYKGEAITAPACTWTLSGYTFGGWTNTVAGGTVYAAEATLPVDVVGGYALTATWIADAPAPKPAPGEPAEYDDEDAAKKAADNINAASGAAKAALIGDPFTGITAEDKAIYANCVKAVNSGKYVTLELSDDGKTTLSNQVLTAVTNINISAIASGTTSTATITTPVPGMWYNLASGTAVGSLSALEANAQQATDSSTAISFSIEKTASATAEFYSLKAALNKSEVGAE